MYRKKALEKELRSLAKTYGKTVGLHRQGKHEIWKCEEFTFPMPRHNKLKRFTYNGILQDLLNYLESAKEKQA